MRWLVALACATALAAQEAKFRVVRQGVGTPLFDVTALATPGTEGSLGFGFTLVEVTSHESEPITAEVSLSDGGDSPGLLVSHHLRLAAGGKERFWLPHSARVGYQLLTVAVGNNTGSTHLQGSAMPFRTLLVASEPALVTSWSSAFGGFVASREDPSKPRARRRGAGPTDALVTRTPEDLPPWWQWLTGFDAIVVDASCAGLGTDHQELLANYAQAGGTLVILHVDRLKTGPLAELRTSRTNFGKVVTVADDGIAALDGGTIDLALQALEPKGYEHFTSVPPEFHWAHRIPGLGTAPVRWFAGFTLAFIVFVLGAMWHFGRRKRRPLMLLLVLPLAGFGSAAIVLGFGYVSEGFATKGRLEALTLLDQRTQRHVTLAGRTLYAPFTPSHLTPEVGTGVYGEYLPSTSYGRRAHSLQLDLAHGLRLGGAALPSRVATALLTASVGKARQRVQFRKDAAGWTALTAPGLVPVRKQDAILLCDATGATFAGDGSGPLTPVSDMNSRLGQLAVGFQSSGMEEMRSRSMDASEKRHGIESVLAGMFSGGLAPGTFVAWVEPSDLVDDLGISTDWRLRRHLVIGTLAPEDFSR